ncbi:MAG: hypothetical protein N2645_23020 [Clostridia bacterium]|nr:hypothetical protein [Clostridia bacterium]
MSRLEDAIDRIKILECPTGELEKRVEGILANFEVADREKITVYRDVRFDRDEAEAYSVNLPAGQDEKIVILAKSGLDDYVVKILDVYIS